MLPDRRGYGRSPDVNQNDCAQDAKDVAALMTQIDEGVHLAGHSSAAVVVSSPPLRCLRRCDRWRLSSPARTKRRRMIPWLPRSAQPVSPRRSAAVFVGRGSGSTQLRRHGGFAPPSVTPELLCPDVAVPGRHEDSHVG